MVYSIASLHGIAESAVWYRKAAPTGKAVSICCAGRRKDPHGLPSQGGAFLPQLQLLVFIHRERILSFEFCTIGLRVIAINLFKGSQTDDKRILVHGIQNLRVVLQIHIAF